MFISRDQLAAIAREANPNETAALALARATNLPFTEAQSHPAARDLEWMIKQQSKPRQADEMDECDVKLSPDHAVHHR